MESDLIFSHCGIGSIHNSLKHNRPTVLIPRYKKYNEFSDDHQLQIASEIEGNALIYMLKDTAINQESFIDFVDKSILVPKKNIDLTNFSLANFIKQRLYTDE